MVLTSTLIEMIEQHWREISDQTLNEIHSDASLLHIQELSERRLRPYLEDLCRHLGERLTGVDAEQLARRQEDLGMHCLEREIPLHEVIHALHLFKRRMFRYIQEAVPGNDSWKLYAQEDLEFRLGNFFDRLIYYVVRGYWLAGQALEDSRQAVAAMA